MSKVLLFQREDDRLQRDYQIVLSGPQNLECIKNYGKDICGYDHKHDFNAARLKTGSLTYCDLLGKGRVGAISISAYENEGSHTTCWQMVFANLPCDDTSCAHPQKLYIFNDKNGFFHIRPCGMGNSNMFNPSIQHVKAGHLLNATHHQNLPSIMCNFHGLSAVREYASEKVPG